jgi:hypothetical protein
MSSAKYFHRGQASRLDGAAHPALTGDNDEGPRFILTAEDGLEDAIFTDGGSHFGQADGVDVFPHLGRVRMQGGEVLIFIYPSRDGNKHSPLFLDRPLKYIYIMTASRLHSAAYVGCIVGSTKHY